MKTHSTDHLLTLGMALTTDRKTMERRVRGVFARKRSAKGIVALALMLALALGLGAFTTACQPGQASVPDTALTSTSDAQRASDSDALLNIPTTSAEYTKENAMEWLAFSLKQARKFPAPRMEDVMHAERGSWDIMGNSDDSIRVSAAFRFLETANALFTKSYVPDDLTATYYIDRTGYRSDVWRFDSNDGVLSGAVEAKSLTFLSADCLNEPSDKQHTSLAIPTTLDGGKDYWSELNVKDAIVRIAGILGGIAQGDKDYGGSSTYGHKGWSIQQSVLFSLGDGRYCTISIFGDENLTPITVCVHPDMDCAYEGVFWRADLERAQSATKLLFPQDFRVGEPGAEDMTKEQAIDFFNRLIDTAGYRSISLDTRPPTPTTTFYVDFSGARENYWHLEGGEVSFDLTSKTGRMLNLVANGSLGNKLGLEKISYADMGNAKYIDATEALFAALFGDDAVESVEVNAVYDGRYCTIDPKLADGSMYEIMYQNGMIMEATNFLYTSPKAWKEVPAWLADWVQKDPETGESVITGFADMPWSMAPNWLADWIYINTETNQVFAQEW